METTTEILELISTDDLIKELSLRHNELIIIRERKKRRGEDNVFVKTGFGKKGRKDKGFDLVEATEMLHAAHWQLVHDYLDDVESREETDNL